MARGRERDTDKHKEGRMWLVAASRGKGKTTALLQVAANLAEEAADRVRLSQMTVQHLESTLISQTSGNPLKNNKSFNKLFLIDIYRNYFLIGFKNSTNNLE